MQEDDPSIYRKVEGPLGSFSIKVDAAAMFLCCHQTADLSVTVILIIIISRLQWVYCSMLLDVAKVDILPWTFFEITVNIDLGELAEYNASLVLALPLFRKHLCSHVFDHLV